jgi:hypothetical protein
MVARSCFRALETETPAALIPFCFDYEGESGGRGRLEEGGYLIWMEWIRDIY